MWIRKPQDEIEKYIEDQEAKRKSLLRPFLFAVAGTAIGVTLYFFGYRGGWMRGGLIITSSKSIGLSNLIFPGVFLFALFFAIALYYHRRSGPSSSEVLLCSECKEPTNANVQSSCECGGRLEPFAFYRWVEDETSEISGSERLN